MTTTDRRRAPASGGNRRGRRSSFGSVRTLPSGRHQARYTGPDGRLYTAPTTFDTKGDAKAWLSLRQAAIIRSEWLPETAMRARAAPTTFGEYSESWLTRRDLKPRTRAHYRGLLDRHLLPAFAPVALASITPRAVAEWHAAIGDDHPTTRAHAYGLLKAILTTAVAEDEITANPCRVRGAGTTRRTVKIRPAGLAELEAIASAMPPRYRALVMVSAWCALRFGEAAELRRSDVDLKAGVLRVRRAVVRVDHAVVVGTPKSTAGARDVAIPPHLVPMLRDHLREHVAFGRDALVFPAADGTSHLAPSSLYRVFYPARAAAGRPDLRWHDLRHTGAVLAAQSGATLAELMGRLGHSTPQAALRYQHVADGRDATVARRMSEIAGGAS